jgi:imidazolonepropionase-like amidohydrolase
MVHANGKTPVRDAIVAGCESIEHGYFMGTENIELMAERQVFWAPTGLSMKAYAGLRASGSTEANISAANLDHQIHQLSLARQCGVAVVIGTDSGGYGLDHGASFAGELRILFSAGYSIEEAIRCATLNGARLLGLENELGVLRAGMPATFLVAEGSPEALLHSLSRPKLLFVEGSLISNLDISSHCTFLPDNLESK